LQSTVRASLSPRENPWPLPLPLLFGYGNIEWWLPGMIAKPAINGVGIVVLVKDDQ
jgi:hypothetical protein